LAGNSAGHDKGLLQLRHFKPEDVVFYSMIPGEAVTWVKCSMMTGCVNVVFFRRRNLQAEDVKDHIGKPLIVVRTEELVSHAIERDA
jgi:cystathionine beta-synthase